MEKLSAQDANQLLTQWRNNIESCIFGQENLVTEALCTLLAGGHILITGAPGLAKTTLVRVIAEFSGLDFGRVQFTPDLLPSDISGTDVLNVDNETGRRTFEFVRGPVFTNLLLADEINRASPRTQSALLEAMQEGFVTFSGKRHPLPSPFMVFATQNPFESEGTFPLPEAQMDRFLMHSLVSYPSADAEKRIYSEFSQNQLVGEKDHSKRDHGGSPFGRTNLQALMQLVRNLRVPDEILEVVRDLVRATRPTDEFCSDAVKRFLIFGAGPRAGIALIAAARAFAFIGGHEAVRIEHVLRMAKPVLRHRMKLSLNAMRDQISPDKVIDLVIERMTERILSLPGPKA